MSAFYLDILKDRLYTHATRSTSRRSAQTALWHILDVLMRLMAPILPFTAEEVFLAMEEGRENRRAESIHTLLFPEYRVEHDRDELITEWSKLQEVREAVLKALEGMRQAGRIGNPLEAKINISAGGETASLLRRHLDNLRYLFIVSQVGLIEGAGNGGIPQVEVLPADGSKCERCWNYSVEVGKDPDYSTLCERCAPVVRELMLCR
jgi:isoleucyl-tRNA synthetase